MTIVQRFRNALVGLIMIIFGVIFFINPDKSYPFITSVISLTMLFKGFGFLLFYFKMARYMVDGRTILYQAIILIDLGLFTWSMTQVPLIYVMLYLVAVNMFAGAVDILRALEARRYGSSWKLTMAAGVISVLLAAMCLVFIKVTKIAVMIYAAGMIYSGIMRLIQSFRRTRMVYIQ